MRDLGASVHRIVPKVHESATTVVARRNFGSTFLGSAAILAAMIGFVVGCAESARERAAST
ncbi:MAG TPA: hypothetical protein VFF52_15485 [Isosphaeraceae bacterium]|nr:hypothetical protein [Isosphaeraceae bacterium]